MIDLNAMQNRLKMLSIFLALWLLVACAQTTDTVPAPPMATATTATIAAGETAVPAAEPAPPGSVAAPEFPEGVEWLNTERPLTLADLRGKVVLLDFWTYGCINCLHVIPDLKRLEEKYAAALMVIGVHSGKFDNERESDKIRQVIRRYELHHPVVNDRDFAIWDAYGAEAWPTFVLINPAGNVVGYHSGEGIYDVFDPAIGDLVTAFSARDALDTAPLDPTVTAAQPRSPLRFPGKVLADADNNRLFIADSNHNRIVITDLEGVVLAVVGNGRAGLQDGDYAAAAFNKPQGMALADADTLYVADTGNHALRRVDLAAGLVTTAAGTGQQGSYVTRGGPGPETPLNSPWDVVAVRLPGGNVRLYIAMAGQHQLWQYDPASGEVRHYAGSGLEALRDGALEMAGFNQPSGLATDGFVLFVADAEASAVRTTAVGVDANTPNAVRTLVGAGLFVFGDRDGVGPRVRLQHPRGVAYSDGFVYVADTYNHKIKRLNPVTNEVETLLGSGADGWADGPGAAAQFDEPGGVDAANGQLYIADTNNHVIRVANLSKLTVETLVLVDPEGLLTAVNPDLYPGEVVTLPEQAAVGGEQRVVLDVVLPDGFKLNDEALFTADIGVGETTASFQAAGPDLPVEMLVVVNAEATAVTADLTIYYCEAVAASLCYIERVRLQAPLVMAKSGQEAQAMVLSYAIGDR